MGFSRNESHKTRPARPATAASERMATGFQIACMFIPSSPGRMNGAKEGRFNGSFSPRTHLGCADGTFRYHAGMILTVTPNPALDYTIRLDALEIGKRAKYRD